MNASWTLVKERLSQRVERREFATWVDPLIAREETEGLILLTAPNRFLLDWFTDNFLGLSREIAKELFSREVSIRVELGEERKVAQLDFGRAFLGEAPSASVRPEDSRKRASRGRFVADISGLNPRYNFARFVVGSSNDFAHAACLSTAKKPGRTFNPLFLYGGTGLGKTHLLHSVGHYLAAGQTGLNIVAMTAERFTNEMIAALQQGHIDAFRKKMRRIDILLMDDIEFLVGKERTQVEFFHTFNELHEKGSQIVLTSDRQPKELTALQERLSTRLSWGLTADIKPADLETRIAILRQRAQEANVLLTDDTSYFLAERFAASIRELEGAFVRMSAYASFHGRTIDLDLARQALSTVLRDEETPVNVEAVQKAVCHFYQVKMTELTGKSRQASLAFPRQVAGYLSREMTDASFPDIGRHFGGRDHTTIIHAHRKIARLRKDDQNLDRTLNELRKRIQSS